MTAAMSAPEAIVVAVAAIAAWSYLLWGKR